MLANFGEKVRTLRFEKKLTREELCGDESELSVRQLARIELGQSIPSLSKVAFIAKKLDVSVGFLTDGEDLELPKRFKELKYLILRTPTYMDGDKLKTREAQFDEIFEDYYDQLPEVEQLVIDCLQSKFDVYQSGDINFGSPLIQEYINQISKNTKYQLNDLLIIDLYLTCAVVSNFSKYHFDLSLYQEFVNTILKSEEELLLEDLFMLNNILHTCLDVSIRLKDYLKVEQMLLLSQKIMSRIQDFQKIPMYCMYYWKYALYHLNDFAKAKHFYEQSVMFTSLTNDNYLVKKLEKEWLKDNF
ncbi:helix-turn-helix domain-containing protein [Streptococcus ictaluri]|uniref:DNA-binding helix-turn-helix protein n=1 Tax=Streptococcus ictaluri 707-05 TaxID=764299 RepID=G5K5D9_9STRE|nr:helix-turn-helix domain-containing protein [Streptococcus ictaluri]EHI69220.1 DNA-binding helix-turn-helix protein [Streptococcus ictaluri 707-05]